MGKTELLAGLRRLYEKIGHCEDLETKIKKQKTEIDEVKGKIESESKMAEETIPQDVPSEISYDSKTHLGHYDHLYRPAQSNVKSVLNKIALILIIAICATATFLLFQAFDIHISYYGILVYCLGFVIVFGFVAWILGGILYGVFFETIASKIGTSADKRADKRNEEKYLLQNKCERQAAYQRDIDEHNKKIRAHRDNAARLSLELDNCQKNLASLNSSLRESASAVAADPSLPAAYKKKEIVATIIEYLENLRADSLKEAINLYEYEKKMNEHNSSMRQAAWERVNQSRLQAEAYERMAEEAARQSAAAEDAARDARRAREANEEARDIIKEWDKRSN